MPASSYAPLADEVDPPFSKATPAAHVTRTGTITYRQPPEESDLGDLGELPRFTKHEKGKGRAGTGDVEQGAPDEDASGSYPPLSSEEEEERRIQANLARFAARDQAEKRARNSRLFSKPPLSPVNSGGRDWGGSLGGRSSRLSAMATLPTTGLRIESPTTPETPNALLDPSTTPVRETKAPQMHHKPHNPFDEPYERTHRSSSSIQADPNSPEPAFGYAGPGWHGGGGVSNNNAAASNDTEPSRMRRVLPDKWWKALCAWGSDLDGGHDNQEDGGQGGRTNPFE